MISIQMYNAFNFSNSDKFKAPFRKILISETYSNCEGSKYNYEDLHLHFPVARGTFSLCYVKL